MAAQPEADRIIELLEQRTTDRVDVAGQAARASGVLDALAALTLVGGVFLGVFALISFFSVGFLYGVVVLLAVALNVALVR